MHILYNTCSLATNHHWNRGRFSTNDKMFFTGLLNQQLYALNIQQSWQTCWLTCFTKFPCKSHDTVAGEEVYRIYASARVLTGHSCTVINVWNTVISWWMQSVIKNGISNWILGQKNVRSTKSTFGLPMDIIIICIGPLLSKRFTLFIACYTVPFSLPVRKPRDSLLHSTGSQFGWWLTQ